MDRRSDITGHPEPRFEAHLAELGLSLPGPFPPHDPLDAVVIHGLRARTSGQLPRDLAGAIAHQDVVLTPDSIDAGVEAARWCALNAVSVLRHALGTLDRIERVLSVIGFVKSSPDFVNQPAVIDGASAALVEIFGDRGRHSRSAIGVSSLPRGGIVEIEVEVALRG